MNLETQPCLTEDIGIQVHACALCKFAFGPRCTDSFRPDDDWSIQSKHWQVIFQTEVGNR